MPITGVIILTMPDKANQVLACLQGYENITTYGIYKTNNIVAVMEGRSAEELERYSDQLREQIPGIIGIYPTYVNFEEVPEGENEEL
ncbi:MAG: hypothetical protein Kow0042_24930 [Calditrichia bacterium]